MDIFNSKLAEHRSKENQPPNVLQLSKASNVVQSKTVEEIEKFMMIIKLIAEQNALQNPIIIQKLKELENSLSAVIKNSENQKQKDEGKNNHMSQVNCQFCSLLVNDLKSLAEHVEVECTFLVNNVPLDYVPRTYTHIKITGLNKLRCQPCDVFMNDYTGLTYHVKSEKHKQKLVELKNSVDSGPYTDFIFCSICRLNVPDNCIQLNKHFSEEIHIQRYLAKYRLTREQGLEAGIWYTWNMGNHCRCLVCNVKFEFTSKQVEIHNNGETHKLNIKNSTAKSGLIKCMTCDVQTGLLELFFHISSPSHNEKVKAERTCFATVKERFCVFCDEKLQSLQVLANHQSECVSRKEVMTSNADPSGNMKMLQDSTSPAATSNLENSSTPASSIVEGYYLCSTCGYQTRDVKKWTVHLSDSEHLKELVDMANIAGPITCRECPSCGLTILSETRAFDLHLQTHGIGFAKPSGITEKNKSKEKEKENETVLVPSQPVNSEKDAKSKTKNNCSININGFPDPVKVLSELRTYFQAYGIVHNVKILGDNSVTIKFTSQSPVDIIMKSNIYRILDTNVEVTRGASKSKGFSQHAKAMALQPTKVQQTVQIFPVELKKAENIGLPNFGFDNKSVIDLFDPLSNM